MTNQIFKTIVFEAISEFYQAVIKPETRLMVEEVVEEVLDRKLEEKLDEKLEEKLEEKLDEKLDPIRASIMSMEKTLAAVTGDFKGQHFQLMDHEKRIIDLESQA